jgi:hypothetical protein
MKNNFREEETLKMFYPLMNLSRMGVGVDGYKINTSYGTLPLL